MKRREAQGRGQAAGGDEVMDDSTPYQLAWRDAERLVERIRAYWAARGQTITIDVIRCNNRIMIQSDLVGGLPAGTTSRIVESERSPSRTIIARVEVETGISFAQMQGPRRTGPISCARAAAMLAVRENAHLSYPAIGAMFGRDHTTAIHNCKAAAKRREVARGS